MRFARPAPPRRLLALVAALPPLVVVASELPPTETDALPSISARHVTLHEPSGTELSRARLELSPAGLRVRQQGAGGRMEVVQDFAAERMWLVDRERSVAHEVLLADAPGASQNAPQGSAGLMAGAPCADRERRREGEGRWRGQPVELWHCLGIDGAIESVEMFSLGWRLVVRVGTPDGRVEELQDIRARDYGDGHFVPAARMRAVGKREFFHGVPEIGHFDETAASSPSSVGGARR